MHLVINDYDEENKGIGVILHTKYYAYNVLINFENANVKIEYVRSFRLKNSNDLFKISKHFNKIIDVLKEKHDLIVTTTFAEFCKLVFIVIALKTKRKYNYGIASRRINRCNFITNIPYMYRRSKGYNISRKTLVLCQ